MSIVFTPRGAFILILFSLFFSGLFTSALILLIKPANHSVLLPATLIIGELLLLVPLFLILRKNPGNYREIIRFKQINRQMFFISIIISIGLVILIDEFERLIALVIPPPEWIDQLGKFLSVEDPIALTLVFLGAVPLAAFSEEILFRGFLQQILEKHWKDVTRAILIGSLFFAVIHLVPYWAIQIYLLSVVMGYMAWVSNSIFPSMILHGINNCAAFCFSNWSIFFEGWYNWNGHVSPIIIVMGIGMTIFGFKKFNTTSVIERNS